MSDTKRRKPYKPFNKERKAFRKRHFRSYRHSVNATTRIFWMSVVDTGLPQYSKTSGWLTW